MFFLHRSLGKIKISQCLFHLYTSVKMFFQKCWLFVTISNSSCSHLYLCCSSKQLWLSPELFVRINELSISPLRSSYYLSNPSLSSDLLSFAGPELNIVLMYCSTKLQSWLLTLRLTWRRKFYLEACHAILTKYVRDLKVWGEMNIFQLLCTVVFKRSQILFHVHDSSRQIQNL